MAPASEKAALTCSSSATSATRSAASPWSRTSISSPSSLSRATVAAPKPLRPPVTTAPHHCPTRQSVYEWVGASSLEGRTPNSITDPEALHRALEQVREQGYAVDDQENEVGINCVAVAAYLNSPETPSGAISVSGVVFRTPLKQLIDQLPLVRSIVAGH
ncbi:IclR family transcriptional regulator domain-containing protein [Aestuariimicrobium ganziense]|uniref:IclR family transcriptional regulator domain-containing protein n=1 Tax=Aestuariimicrobium ganziense TaxID=2773677 RepID=UPI001F18C452|nr:IclR family transcriptional regulator C-terminal domain-containing protein [Aestuariimicrobium ganziense]